MAYIPGKDNVNDVLYGTLNGDSIWGFSGDDRLFGFEGDDTLMGGANNDVLTGGVGADYLSGGTGYDIASYTDSTAGVWVQIGGYGYGGTSQGDFVAADIEQLDGSAYADILMASGNGDYLKGNEGNDYLFGGAGYDVLVGGGGRDWLEGGANVDDLYGGSGTDTVAYSGSSAGVTVTIGGIGYYGDAAGDWIGSDVENLSGSAYGDALFGSSGSNTLDGWKGDDYLYGYGGYDTLIGGLGADYMNGGADEDTVSYEAAGSAVWIDLYKGQGSNGEAQGDRYYSIEDARGSNYNDTFLGSNGDNDLYGLGGRDFMWAGNGNDYLSGGDGNDGLAGEAGRDLLVGGAGNDELFGGTLDDRLSGDDGNDILTGGTGADRFNFSQHDLGDIDTIKDFHRSEGDKIGLSGIDANTKLAGNQAFTFIGTAAFTGVAGQLHYSNNGVETVLTGDVNGDKVADFTIKFTDAPGLIASDFYL